MQSSSFLHIRQCDVKTYSKCTTDLFYISNPQCSIIRYAKSTGLSTKLPSWKERKREKKAWNQRPDLVLSLEMIWQKSLQLTPISINTQCFYYTKSIYHTEMGKTEFPASDTQVHWIWLTLSGQLIPHWWGLGL